MFEWLRREFPVRGARLRIVSRNNKYFGWVETSRRGPIVYVVLNKYPTEIVEDTLLHEWPHCMVPKGGHPPAYWQAYGRVYRRWMEQGGRTACFMLPGSTSARGRRVRRRSQPRRRSR